MADFESFLASHLARACDNAAVMRLGYFLELAGHEAQAKALEQFAELAKSVKLLDPTSKEEPTEMSGRSPASPDGMHLHTLVCRRIVKLHTCPVARSV